MRFVSVKSVEQQDVQAAHRIHAGLVEQRTAKANQVRGLMAEYGLVAPKELSSLRRAIPCWLEDAGNGLSDRFRHLLDGLWQDIRALDSRVAELDADIGAIAQSDPDAVRLQQLRGVGPMIATALVAAVGDARHFSNGRQLSAALGLTPRQHSSGGKERLLGISKRGDAYLRSLLVHGEQCPRYSTGAPLRLTTDYWVLRCRDDTPNSARSTTLMCFSGGRAKRDRGKSASRRSGTHR